MGHRPDEQQQQLRSTLFQLWAGAYEYAGGEMAPSGDVPDIAKLFFAKFICQFHSELVSSQEEWEFSHKLVNCISEDLLIALDKELADAAEETGVEPRIFRAMVHGVAFARAAKQRDRLVDTSLAKSIVQKAADCLRDSVDRLRRRATA